MNKNKTKFLLFVLKNGIISRLNEVIMKKEFRDLCVNSVEEASVILLGLPFDDGCSCGKGSKDAPKVMRELSYYLPAFTMDGGDIHETKIFDCGDVENGKDFYKRVKEKADEVFKYNKFNLFLGGDHSVTIPLEQSFLEKAKRENKIPVIIHIDAHPDICDFYDGSNYSHACTNRRAIDHGYETKNITMIGIRGYEAYEVDYLNAHPELKVYRASYLNKEGYEEVIKDLESRFGSSDYSIYLSYDIDANDPSFAPGTGTPEAFGLNSKQLRLLIKKMFMVLPIEAMDIVEVSPALDCNDITSWLALKTLYEIFEILKKKEVK